MNTRWVSEGERGCWGAWGDAWLPVLVVERSRRGRLRAQFPQTPYTRRRRPVPPFPSDPGVGSPAGRPSLPRLLRAPGWDWRSFFECEPWSGG